MASPPSTQEILHAYRHLFKGLLRAVQFSTPARYTIRDRIRASFRTSPATDFRPERVARTLEFLDHARKYRGLEHRILRNLLRVAWERRRLPYLQIPMNNMPFRKRAYDDYDRTVRMFNESMGLCLE